MRGCLLFTIALSQLSITAYPCAWDRDTAMVEARLAKDASGRFDVMAAIVGMFDRNPAAYYEMRLARVKGELQNDPKQLMLYDDAGVAADRLGRSDEGIEWMERKNEQMRKMGETVPAEQRYRYLANLGTFYAHRWIKRQDRFGNKADLKKAIELINRAIAENQKAHFGREVYQIVVLDWLNEVGPLGNLDAPALHPLTRFYQLVDAMQRETGRKSDVLDAVSGLAGLVELGAAWESVDVIGLITYGLHSAGKWSLAALAQLRLKELIDAQKQTVYPGTAFSESLKTVQISTARLSAEGSAGIASFFAEARTAVESRHKSRTAYMVARLTAGKHPDTDTDFWKEWSEPKMPRYPN